MIPNIIQPTTIPTFLLSKMESINDMSHLINKISSQTNLLAMNAAIEASHAGESGRGFAVVADEIRKLAENSNTSSKQIQNLIKEMVSIAKQAEISGQDSREAFSKIKKDVAEVADAFSEITFSTSELTSGAVQIREAVTHLNNIANDVSAKYDEIDISTKNVSTGCQEVMSITEYMKNALGEISIAINLISESIAGVREISLKLDDISGQLNSEISKYILN
ncbi:MAG: hypothetical protein JXR70_03450 [Spirochaetales bacterium]|nr:hypothetical protein [Spirochaetales bacterium]